jgi:predicted DNA-binding protein
MSKKRHRYTGDQDIRFQIRMSKEMWAKVDFLANLFECSKAEAIKRLIDHHYGALTTPLPTGE